MESSTNNINNISNENKLPVEELHFWYDDKAFLGCWCVDITPIFINRYGDDIIQTAIVWLCDGYTRSKADMKQYTENLLNSWKKRPTYSQFAHEYEIHITFANGRKTVIQSDYNGVYFSADL